MAESPHRKRRKMEPLSAETSPLVGLPQIIIDLIAKHLDLKSLVRLQLTCRDLFAKCLNAQRLKTVDFAFIRVQNVQNEGRHVLTFGQPYDDLPNISMTQRHLRATKFRIVADDIRFQNSFNNVSITHVKELLSGRSSVARLVTRVDIDYETDPVIFEQLIRELKISELSVGSLPIEFWQLPAVKQMTGIHCWGNFPLSLEYLAETAFEDCWLQNAVDENLNAGLNTSLQKWARGQKEIEKWTICTEIVFNEEELFKDFYLVPEEEKDSKRRSLVVRTRGHPFAKNTYTVERADGAKLYVEYFSFGQLDVNNTPKNWQN